MRRSAGTRAEQQLVLRPLPRRCGCLHGMGREWAQDVVSELCVWVPWEMRMGATYPQMLRN